MSPPCAASQTVWPIPYYGTGLAPAMQQSLRAQQRLDLEAGPCAGEVSVTRLELQRVEEGEPPRLRAKPLTFSVTLA